MDLPQIVTDVSSLEIYAAIACMAMQSWASPFEDPTETTNALSPGSILIVSDVTGHAENSNGITVHTILMWQNMIHFLKISLILNCLLCYLLKLQDVRQT